MLKIILHFRPLPQRYPPATGNGQPVRTAWNEDHYDPNRSNGSMHRPTTNDPCGGMRQQYESPPKPANRVPLQLQVHQEKGGSLKRNHEQPEGSCPQGYMISRGANTPRQSTERLTVDCGQRGSTMELNRKDGHPGMPIRPELRPPPPVPGRRPPPPRGPMQNGMDSALKRNNTQGSSGLLRHCYPMQTNGSVPPSHGYPPTARPVIDGAANYEPRYSKSGKLVPRSQDSRPMPPPVVMLRTGPLGTYPDAETLKRSEMASSYNRLPDRNGTNSSDYDRQYHKPPSQGDISQQIFVDTNSYSNGQSMIADHLAIPYRIPQVSPKNPRPMFDGNSLNNGMRKEPLSLPCSRSQPSPSSNHFQNSSPSNGFKSRTLPVGSRPLGDCPGSPMDYRNRRPEPNSPYYDERGILHEPRNPPCPRPNPSRNGLSADARVVPPNTEDDVIYANQQLPYHSSNSNKKDYPQDQQRTPPMLNGNGPLYENSMRNGSRGIQDSCPENIYANHHVANSHYTNQSNQQQISNYDNKHGNGIKNPRSDRRNTHPPPPVAQKPSHSLPQPSEMVMITETRGWNGQASSTYAKDVVKPTPRMPRLPNGLLASSAQLTTVPAYQCVINELSSRPPHQVSPTDSSTLSLRSSYDSSSSSSREFCRRPNKSVDGGVEQRRTAEDKELLNLRVKVNCTLLSCVSEHIIFCRMTDEGSKRKEKSSIFSASPWEREEKEKLQHEQILDARRARDQEIAYLESIPDRTEKQNEWLQILRLEREFQRRAEMHDDEDSICSDTSSTESSSDKMANFPRDKLTVIPNERIGLKLLDELLDSPPKNSQTSSKSSPERELPLRSPSEKHFIPLDVAIPDNELQPSSLPITNNILKISSEQHSDSGNRVSKPPVPAPRPSKALLTSHLQEIQKSSEMSIDLDQTNGKLISDIEANVSSLTKLEISDSSAFFCATDSEEHGSRETPQDNWMIEVPNNFPDREEEQKSKPSGMSNEQSRIYENIKPADYHYLRTQTVSSSGYSSHTLPKSSSIGPNTLASSKEVSPPRNGSSRVYEKKFPVMGVSSTLTKKANGFAPSDVDILPSLYASYKVQNGYTKDVPADLEDKSPEFKKLWISRPEKLTFQDKIRKFSLQAGEDDLPKDRVKNSRAQREIEIKFNEAQKRVAAQKASEAQV
ncbi:uncharacterized protein NPIL_442501 [Nephila pilipes]|uniref:Uncharacterized protein n=1 Tax=Nephila pilipes TaxID=299642 RepID=A0A8X6R4W5_NEPPI|nr:uncharacterized protein NPIL_84591 [Nephila pilipes]GFU49616.1 uncharacterized protein NPIL_442501 [Nephila pilipes]